MNNEKGGVSILALTILLVLTTLSLLIIKKRVYNLEKIRAKQHAILCVKELNGETQKLVKFINKTNKSLKILTIGKFSSRFIPVYGLVTSQTVKQAIIQLKRFQQLRHISYMKNLITLRSKKCTFAPNIYKTPYKYNLSMGLKRDALNRAKVRKRKWKYYYLNSNFVIRTRFSMNGKSKSNLIKRANLSSLFSYL